jgi:branched-chain amino acid transport system substrate-binding protein
MASKSPQTRFTRRRLFLGLVAVIITSSSFIFLAKVETREYYSHWIIGISAAVAALLAIFILLRQKHHHGLIEKADLALGIALTLSLCAEIVLAVYDISLETVPPVPSLADLFSISSYAFLAYYVFSTYLRFYRRFHFSTKPMIVTTIVSGIFLFYIISVTLSLANFSSPRGVALFSVLVAYPILDAIIIVPSFLIVLNYRKEPLWFTPWVFKSAGILLLAIADSWFAFFVVTSLTNELWPSAMVISSHSVIVAAGLLWYMKFLITPKDIDSNTDQSRRQTNTNNKDSKLLEADNIKIHKVSKPRKRMMMIGTRIRIRIRSVPFIVVVALSISVLMIAAVSFTLFSSNFPLIYLPFFTSDPRGGEAQVSNTEDNTVKIGALLPLTGVASSSGKSTEAALNIAVKDVNDSFLRTDSSLRFELVTEDTESNPSKSLEKLKLLAEKGIKTVIGPATSAELDSVRNYANNNDILLVSPSSTASSLAIEGDNVFRFVPDDTHQAEAISSLMWHDGVRVVVPFWRNDIYGSELMRAVQENFQEMGGQLDMDKETRYEPRNGQLAASLYRINFALWDKDMRILDSKVQQAITMYGASRVGVYIISLDEISPIFIQAHSYPSLSKVKWYGSDGSVLNEGLIRNHDSAHFAINTSFYNPIFKIDYGDNGKLDNLLEQIHKEVKIDPSPYSAVAYDIFWVLAKAENNTRYSETMNNGSKFRETIYEYKHTNSSTNNDATKKTANFDGNYTAAETTQILNEEMVRTANTYNGITGNMTLNAMGDRGGGEYDFWAVKYEKDNDKAPFQWQRVDSYGGN